MFRSVRPVSLILLGALAAPPAAAHEYWLQPGRYSASHGDTVIVNAFVGTGSEAEKRAYDPERAERLTIHVGGAPRDLVAAWPDGDGPGRGATRPDDDGANLPAPRLDGDGSMVHVVAPDEGGAVVAYLSRFSYIELERDRFDAYLREEGLDGPLATRTTLPESGGPGRERFRRCAKTWIAPRWTDAGAALRIMQPVGLPLEIVPLGDPASSQPLRLQVRFQGAPLAGALVRARHTPLAPPLDPSGQDATGTSLQGRTDSHGRVELRLDAPGEWLIATVHMVPCPERTVADWESYWASLTFARSKR